MKLLNKLNEIRNDNLNQTLKLIFTSHTKNIYIYLF